MDNLIFDRTQADVAYAAELNRKLNSGEALTAQELADWNAGLKGTYNATDMNRVDAAVRELGGLLTAAGYPVRYTSPFPQPQPKPQGNSDIELTSADLQQGAWLGATGTYQNSPNYICTISPIPIVEGFAVTVRTNLNIENDGGILWYNKDMQYLSGSYLLGLKKIEWDGCFQGIAPPNAAFCHVNVNMTGITPNNAGTIYVRQELDPEYAPLPDGYSRVEYIESTGSEYVNTGYKPNGQSRITMDCALMDTATAACLYCSRSTVSSTAPDANVIMLLSSGVYRCDYYGHTSSTSGSYGNGERFTVDNDQGKISIGQYSITYTESPSESEMPWVLMVAAAGTGTSIGSFSLYAKLKLYSCNIYDNGVLVRYYIPCTDPSGKTGLYDTVSGSFFGNAIASSVDLPSGYTQVEYIQSSASGGQYIDTGYKPNNNSRVIFDTDIIIDIDDGPKGLFGGRQAYQNKAFALFVQISDSGNYNDAYATYFNRDIKTSLSGRHLIDKNQNTTYIDGTAVSSFALVSFASPVNMTLFAVNQGTGVDPRQANCKLYKCVIYDSGNLVRKYFPCKSPSGSIGLYDTVDSKFYSNAGGSVFTAGVEVFPGFEPGMPIPDPAPPDPEDTWRVGDIVVQSEWAQYLANVQALRDAYYAMASSPTLPEPTAPLTYTGANDIEKLLFDVQTLYKAMSASYRKCGTFQAGANTKRLPLQRSVT